MDKVYWLTDNTKLIKNGFSSANAAIELENEEKDVITTAVTATILKKDNEHALALREMCTTNEHDLQKKYCKRSPPSERELTD